MAKGWLNQNWYKVIIILMVLVGLGLVVYFFSNSSLLNLQAQFLPQSDLNRFNQNPTGTCSLTFDKENICVDETVSGVLNDGANANCRVGFSYNGGEWQLYGDFITDASGNIGVSDSPSVAGTYVFAGVCIDDKGVACRTNDETVVVTNCADDDSGCVDSDGGIDKDTPGHVTLGPYSSYDECWDDTEVLEFYCDEDGALASTTVDCEYDYVNDKPLETCIETRSGGYCQDVESSGYEVGDIIASGGGSFNGYEEVYDIIKLKPGDNPCVLGMRVNVFWTSWNDDDFPMVGGNCFNMNDQDFQKLYVFVQDSIQMKYSDVMYPPPPTQRNIDVSPMEWSAANPNWLINIMPDYDEFDFPPSPGCDIKYTYSYEIYNYDCFI